MLTDGNKGGHDEVSRNFSDYANASNICVLSLDALPATLTACSPIRQFNASTGLRTRSPASLDQIFAILGFYAA